MMRKASIIGIVSKILIGGYICLLLIIVTGVEAAGPTEVGGYFSIDTIWTLANSPYIVKEKIIVEENVNLTIEPGVLVKFDVDTYIRIDGRLYAVGTEENKITFTSNKNDSERGDWGGLKFESTSKGNIIKYCDILHSGIDCDSTSITIINNSIYHGGVGIDLSYCSNSSIINNTIEDNEYGIYSWYTNSYICNNSIKDNQIGLVLGRGEQTIINNVISKSDIGIVVAGDPIIKYNYIMNCELGFHHSSGDSYIYGNIIINNHYDGISWEGGSSNISNNVFKFNGVAGIHFDLQRYYDSSTVHVYDNNITNNGIGIEIEAKGLPGSAGTALEIKNNNIFNNSNYDISNSVKKQINATNNWWGTTDTSKINENIYDYYDDFEFGKVLYLPILITPNPNAPDASSYSEDTSGEFNLVDNDNNNLDLFNPTIIPGVLVGGTITSVGAAAIIAKINENWKFLLLSLFGIPLFTRIHGKKTLDNFVRGQVYGHIQSKPGTHFNEIRKTLKLGNGNLAYHLYKLEKEGFITSKRDKRNRRFYPVGVEVPEEDGIKLSKTQENILDYIERHPKSGQKEIASELKESQQTISYNINVLVREGFLKEDKFKGTKRYLIMDENT